MSTKCGHGGRGVKKSKHFADVICGWSIKESFTVRIEPTSPPSTTALIDQTCAERGCHRGWDNRAGQGQSLGYVLKAWCVSWAEHIQSRVSIFKFEGVIGRGKTVETSAAPPLQIVFLTSKIELL